MPQKEPISGWVSLHPWWRLQMWLPAQYVEFQSGLHLGPSDHRPVVQANPLPKHHHLPTRGLACPLERWHHLADPLVAE